MKNKQPLIFPVVLTYRGELIKTKGIKCVYGHGEIIYKIALPSSLSSVPLCWMIRDGETWKLEFDGEMEPFLKALLIHIVIVYEETRNIYPALNLKSA